jgi:molybdenum cofactor cytidylyltransferase
MAEVKRKWPSHLPRFLFLFVLLVVVTLIVIRVRVIVIIVVKVVVVKIVVQFKTHHEVLLRLCGGLRRRLRFGRRISGPEVTTAAGAHPELIGRPRHIRSWVAHLHIVATPLTPDMQAMIAHAGILAHHSQMIPGVVLAAGKSSRMGGRAKAMLPASEGETFVSRIVRTFRAAGVADVVVVLGHQAMAIAKALAERRTDARVVVNEAFESGQLSSVLAGLEAIDRPGVSAMLLTLVDVPLVGVATVRAVMDRYRETGALIVRPVQGELHGHPVLIDRSLFGKLRSADPAGGAKPVVRAHASAVGDVEVDDEGAFADIDTPEDYARVLNRLR